MSRQRTINDQGFWRSPRLQICTTEDKIALVHLLTCPDSNVVGAYPLVPKIACAEVGWSADQWLQVIDRLRANDLTWYDAERMFVWVRIWWEHHHAGQSMGPKLRNRTLGDIRNIPHTWLQPFLDDFRPHLSPEYQLILDRELGLLEAADTLSISCRYGIDRVSNLSLSNPNSNPNPNSKVTLTPRPPATQPVDISAIPASHRADVGLVLREAQQSGRSAADLQTVIKDLARQFQSPTKPPRNPIALTRHLLGKQENNTPQRTSATPSPERLAVYQGRCFAWPLERANNYVRISEHQQIEYFCIEHGQFVRRVGRLESDELLCAIEDGSAREVSGRAIEMLAQEIES